MTALIYEPITRTLIRSDSDSLMHKVCFKEPCWSLECTT